MSSDVQGAPEALVEVPAAGNGNGATPKAKAKVKAAKSPAKKASGKEKVIKTAKTKTAKAKTKSKAAPQRDPIKLDQFGLRKGSVKSQAAALYARAKGATLAEVKERVNSVQFNVISELENKGFKVTKTEEKAKQAGGRRVTRYKLHPKT